MTPNDFWKMVVKGEFAHPVKLREDYRAVIDSNGKLIAEFPSEAECLKFVLKLTARGKHLLEKARRPK